MISTQSVNTGVSEIAGHSWPRIALVTPVRNSGAYIEQTILSVVSQNYPNLDYFIVDGGSTDNTVEIIRKYEKHISGWVSEPDQGMYDALNKGFARTTGEVMGWISATDKFHTGGLFVVGGVFRDLPQVEWITGRPTSFNEEGVTALIEPLKRWSRYRFLAGANRYIQQESTFWRRSLWEKAGGYIDATRRMASDFELWVRFFRHAQLHSVDALIAGFRVHPVSLGIQLEEECHAIQRAIIDAELQRDDTPPSLRRFRSLDLLVKRVPKVRNWWHHHVLLNLQRTLYHRPSSDWPPVIHCQLFSQSQKWVFRP
jgi:glycosyltransferase involved in cell wall biosynthesis